MYSLSTTDAALVKHKAIKLTSGTPKKEKSILEAGESTTFSLEAKTIKAGDFMISPAEVQYTSSLTEDAEIRVCEASRYMLEVFAVLVSLPTLH